MQLQMNRVKRQGKFRLERISRIATSLSPCSWGIRRSLTLCL
ncbi:hypothetical protein [Acidovorax sp.]